MAIPLQGDPYNLQGNTQPIQGGNSANILQPANAPVQVAGPPAPPPPAPAVVATPKPTPVKTASRVANQPAVQKPSVYFYKPDPNSQQVYDANGTPLSYEQYISAGGLANFSNVLNQSAPNQRSGTATATPVITNTPKTTTTDPKQSLAEAAGQSGVSVDDFIKLLSSQNGATPDQENEIRKSLGIDTLEQQVFSAPSKTTEQLYTEAYTSAGLADIKSKIAALDSQIADKRQQLTDAEGVINENPFLSEASRVGRIKRLNDQAQSTISNLIEQQNQYTSLYNSGLGEVRDLVTRYTNDFTTTQNLNQNKLNYLEKKALEQIKQKESANSSSNLSNLTAYLQAKAKAQKPDTIGGSETGYFAYDPTTGKFNQIIAPSQKLDTSITEVNGKRVVVNNQTGAIISTLGSTKGEGSGVGSGSNELAKVVLENPTLFNQLTPTEKAKIAPILNNLGFDSFGKPLSDTAIQTITNSQNALLSLQDLRASILGNEQYIGPISGLQALNPYSDARKIQAEIDQVRQRVGKALEGGVLRKEDEEKYKKILATITDVPETAISKIDSLIKNVQRDIDTYTANQQLGGRNVTGINTSTNSSNSSADPLGVF